MAEIYTAAVWTVKDGREEDFVRLWRELGTHTVEDFPNAGGPSCANRERPNRFISFGAWESVEQVDRWRASPAFRDAVGQMEPVLASFEPGTFDVELKMGRA